MSETNWPFTDLTDEDTNSILWCQSGNHRQCGNASSATWWPNLLLIQVAPSGGQNWNHASGAKFVTNATIQFPASLTPFPFFFSFFIPEKYLVIWLEIHILFELAQVAWEKIQAHVAQMHTRETLIREPSNISLTLNDLVFIMFYIMSCRTPLRNCDIENNAEKNISVSNVVFTVQFGRSSSDGEHTRFSSCFQDCTLNRHPAPD